VVAVAWRMIVRDRDRFVVTTAGIGFSGLLMLFLFAVYEGVQAESNGYVVARPVDVWVSQGNATNLIKSNSLVPADRAGEVAAVAGVAAATPMLRTIATIFVDDRPISTFVLGIEPGSAVSEPSVVRGRSQVGAGEIVLDRAFAAKHGFDVGDAVALQDRSLRVVGISTGTNALLAQFSFVTLEEAQALAGVPSFVSFWLVTAEVGVSPAALATTVRSELPGLNALPHAEFSANNLAEIRTGVLPILWIVAILGAVTGAAILTLLVYGGVMERRADYALLKAIGAPQRYVAGVVLKQSLLAVLAGAGFAVLAYLLMTPVLVRLVPELTVRLTAPILLMVLAAMVLLGMAGAWAPIRMLRRIYPGEVFRA
jgi:putative ABC transport system permease protein